MTETKKRIENIKSRIGSTVENKDAYIWSLDAAFLLDQFSSLETKLQKAVEALKSDCFCEYNESVRPVTLVTQCIYCKTIKELES